MAATVTICCPGVAMTASSTRLLDILNGHASKLVKIYRIWFLAACFTSTGTGAGTATTVTGTSSPYGVPSMIAGYRSSGTPTGGTSLTTTFSSGRGLALNDTATVTTSLTVTMNATGGSTADTTAPFLFHAKSNDEPAAGGFTWDEMGNIPVLNNFDFGYGDSNVEPIVLRQNEGVTIQTMSIGAYVASYNLDIFVELTYA